MAEPIDFVETAPLGKVALEDVALRLNPVDDVAIVRVGLPVGTILTFNDEQTADEVPIKQFIPVGHKVALRAIAPGEPIRRYGQIIGFATQAVEPGEQVHSHNLSVGDFDRDYAFGVDVQPVVHVPESDRRTFLGYRRADGRVATRNYIAVIASVNCSAHTTYQIAHAFTPEMLAAYPNVDGVIALAHFSGCGISLGGQDYTILQRTLAGMAQHVNVGAYIIVGLGCEMNQIRDMIDNYNLRNRVDGDQTPPNITIQEEGGIRKTVDAGVGAIKDLLPVVNQVERSPQPVSELNLALQCGGSDGWSGVTANPVVGLVADELVRQGGTAVLGETTEIYGAEHLLTRRAISREVGEKLVSQVRWWEQHTAKLGIEIDNNPTIGNKLGGLTTIYEKSLGAVAKGGSTPLMGVYDYAEPVTVRGFTFMNTPGYDPVSVTGQVAGGCNLVLFTTGRGSAFGFKPAPSIKIATNSAVYSKMTDDMDFDAGRVLDTGAMDAAAAELFDLVVAVASGEQSKSEAQNVGDFEFNPWNLGGTL